PSPRRSLCSCAPRRPARSTLSPYTTLFRSGPPVPGRRCSRPASSELAVAAAQDLSTGGGPQPHSQRLVIFRAVAGQARGHDVARSEEHTSELQSREKLVCRLLLEKKKGPEA